MEANNFKRFKKQSPLYRLWQRGSLDVNMEITGSFHGTAGVQAKSL